MKRRAMMILVILLATVFCSAAFAPLSAVSAEKTAAVSAEDPVLAARFLNMLNHNASYDADFDSVDTLVNNAVGTLCHLRDSADEDFIDVNIVADYMMNLYGIELTDVSALNAGFPQKEGYLFILPRGLTSYTHRFVSACENEDGSFSVETEVTITPHDGESETVTAVSLFVRNPASAFGFNLVYSNLLYDAAAV